MRAASIVRPTLLALLCAAPLAAQSPAQLADGAPREGAGRADSTRALRTARTAQSEYERIRLRNAPWTMDGGSGGHCDEIIGRFCLWDSGSEDSWKAPPERPAQRVARDSLLARLTAAAERVPGDGWVAGQRVRYLVEAGRTGDALAAARGCRAERWWCLALEGFAAHAAGDYLPAEGAFTAALAAMPEDERRDWTDLTPVLPAGDVGGYRRLRGAERAAAERRFWWLADPLWMDTANDRRTEHGARLVFDRLQERARTTERIAWADDLRQILIRYGWPTGWEKIRPRMHQTGPDVSVVTHYASKSWEFIPRFRAVAPGAELPADTWELDARQSHTTYSPRYAAGFGELDHQVAVFRRGAGHAVVAAYGMKADSVAPGAPVRAGLVLAPDDSAEPVRAIARGVGPSGFLRADAAFPKAIVSVEARAGADSGRVERARYAITLERASAGGVAISDVLLLADPAARPATLDEAAPLARPGTRLRAGERMGLFWEMYRAPDGPETLRISLALARRASGGVRRVAERIGLADAGTPVRVRWTEEAGGAGLLSRATTVALPATLAPGEYLLEVTVQPPGGPAVTATRAVTITN